MKYLIITCLLGAFTLSAFAGARENIKIKEVAVSEDGGTSTNQEKPRPKKKKSE